MECCCRCSSLLKPQTLDANYCINIKQSSSSRSSKLQLLQQALQYNHGLSVSASTTSPYSYKKFINFAVNQTENHTTLVPSPLQEKYHTMTAMDGRTELQMLCFQAPKIRLLRSLSIENESMQVLDFAVFPRPEFDIPIFCANFFTTVSMNIIVLDLNPLYDVTNQKDYKAKYYKSLMPLGLKYAELFPWGGKLTSESIRFFSPIVIWTKFSSSEDQYNKLYSAFREYFEVWLGLMDQAVEESDEYQVIRNREAQHRYLTWRAEKDPGRGVLKRLIGEELAETGKQRVFGLLS